MKYVFASTGMASIIMLTDKTEMKYFKGQKNPPMPKSFCYLGVLPLKVLCHQVVSLEKSQCNDFSFIKSNLSIEGCLDFNTKKTLRVGSINEAENKACISPAY